MTHIEIKQIRLKDLNKARRFAVDGMHLSRYVNNKIELYLYSKYVVYLEFSKSTTVLGAYLDNKLVGFLFCRFKDKPAIYTPRRYKIYCKLFSKLMDFFGYQSANSLYDNANKEMLERFMVNNNNPDGEITFFAVDSKIKGKGIGTLLLNNLIKRNKNKLVYLFSDSGSTYQFYLHRGFEESGKKEVTIPFSKGKEVPLTCYLFSKKLLHCYKLS